MADLLMTDESRQAADDKAECERLRLLMQALERRKNIRGIAVSIGPTADGFGLIVTSSAKQSDIALAVVISEHLAVLFGGVLRWTEAARQAFSATPPEKATDDH